jgi:transaldolase
MNPLTELQRLGQSVWLDSIDRRLLTSGELKCLVEQDGVTGVTSNPTIFDKAISGSDDYDDQIMQLAVARPGLPVADLYEELAIADIQMAADVLRSVYDRTEGRDGYVSLEASPHLADDTDATIAEVRRLIGRVDRPNLMIKVPATPEGIPAIQTLIGEGRNINVTLMFSMDHYEAVANAYLHGIARAPQPTAVASVASFFVSRVDTKVDKRLDEIGAPDALALRGKAAVANSRLVYRRFREIFDGPEFATLRAAGARVQRVLWGSTSTKNPDYPDLLYVDTLIGPDTVNTMPPATLDAFRDHGTPHPSVDRDLDEAETVLASLRQVGIDLREVTEELQREGVKAFADSFDHLLSTIDEKRKALAA